MFMYNLVINDVYVFMSVRKSTQNTLRIISPTMVDLFAVWIFRGELIVWVQGSQ